MSFEQIWEAIRELCPNAEIQQGIGEAIVFLPGIRYLGLNNMFDVAGVKGKNKADASKECGTNSWS